jgi:integrase
MLTATKLDKLRPKSAPFRVADGQGLSIEVNPGGAKTWVYRYRLNGRQAPVRLGRYPAISLAEARERRLEAEKLVAHGKSPAIEKTAHKAGLSARSTVAQFSERFMEDRVKPVRKSTTQIERYFRKQIIPEIGAHKLTDVTPQHVLTITDRLKGYGSPMAALEVRNLLKRLFAYAIARQLATFNPAAAIPASSIATLKSRDRVLTANEIHTYLDKLYRSDIARRYALSLHLILMTLVRKSELVLARWSEIDLGRGEWHIPAANTKMGKPRIVYLPTQAIALFAELKTLACGSDFVLPGRNKPTQPIGRTALNTMLRSIKFGIPEFTIHDSRRTASTHLHEMGWKSDVIEKALGHEVGGVRGIYNRAEYATERKKMLQQWATFVESLLTGNKVVGINWKSSVNN